LVSHGVCRDAGWRDLVLLNWSVNPALLASHVTAGTDLDVAALAGKPDSGVNGERSGVEVFSVPLW